MREIFVCDCNAIENVRASTKFETFTIAIVPLLLWKKEGTNRDFLTDQYWSLRKK